VTSREIFQQKNIRAFREKLFYERFKNMDEKNIANQKIKPLHTYESDMADIVREQEGTVIKIALAEKEKNEEAIDLIVTQKAFSKNIFYVIGGIILLILSVWGTLFLIQKGKEASKVEIKQTHIDGLINEDYQTIVDITSITNKIDLVEKINTASKKEIKNGNINSIILVTTVNDVSSLVKTQDFLKLMEVNITGSFSRSLDDTFMLGVYNNNLKNNFFLILKTNDYNQSFAGMLLWEATLLYDTFEFLNIDVSQNTQNIFETPWVDKIIENKDSRILKNPYGEEILTYMFLDKNKVIITSDQVLIKEVLSRIIIQNLKPL